jgi:predicted TIM-barrel fold metal-dependent hydrolase
LTDLALATFGWGWHLEASSGMLNPTLLRHALEVTTPDRLLFSTDYPFQRPGKFGTAFATDEDRERFMAGNARALFAITDRPSPRGTARS